MGCELLPALCPVRPASKAVSTETLCEAIPSVSAANELLPRHDSNAVLVGTTHRNPARLPTQGICPRVVPELLENPLNPNRYAWHAVFLDTGCVHLISLMWLEDVIASSSCSEMLKSQPPEILGLIFDKVLAEFGGDKQAIYGLKASCRALRRAIKAHTATVKLSLTST